MALFSRELLVLNRKMKIVTLVIAVCMFGALFFLWRDMSYRSLGQNAAYKKPMNLYTKAEKLMIRGKYRQALEKYTEVERQLRAIPGIDLSRDFYFAIVNNALGTVHLRLGIYGENDKDIKLRSDLGRNQDEISLSLEMFRQSASIYRNWLADNRPDEAALKALAAGRVGKAADKIKLEPFERYERALSVTLTNCGMARRYLEDYDGARQCYKEALALWPENDTAHDNLDSMEKVLKEEKPEKSLDKPVVN